MMRILCIILVFLIVSGNASAQLRMPGEQLFFNHTNYRLLGDDVMQISLITREDRKLLPPLDSIIKPYMRDYQRIADTAQKEVVWRRVEYDIYARRAYVYIAPNTVNGYYFVDDQYFTAKQGRDTISILGKLSNGRRYRVRFMVDVIKDMRKYATGNLDALIEKNGKAGELKKEESR